MLIVVATTLARNLNLVAIVNPSLVKNLESTYDDLKEESLNETFILGDGVQTPNHLPQDRSCKGVEKKWTFFKSKSDLNDAQIFSIKLVYHRSSPLCVLQAAVPFYSFLCCGVRF